MFRIFVVSKESTQMNKDNNFGRLLLLLLITLGICLGFYYLPDQLFGMKIKKVDLLSDLRIKPESLSMDSCVCNWNHRIRSG